MSDYRQQEGWREQQWRQDIEAKHPSLLGWPGRKANVKSIASALVKAQKEFGPALKTNTNPHFRSKYADLSACVLFSSASGVLGAPVEEIEDRGLEDVETWTRDPIEGPRRCVPIVPGLFPVTLYKEQWDRLLQSGEEIRKFIADNDDKLKKKEG